MHRIGRTGRAGRVGNAVSLVSSDEKPWLAEIEKLIKLKIQQEIVPGFDPEPDFFEAGRGRKRSGPRQVESFDRSEPRGESRAPRGGGRAPRGEGSPQRAERGSDAPRRARPVKSIAADGFDFSKPYEPVQPAAGIASDLTSAAAPAAEAPRTRTAQRPIAVLLGGLGRK